MNDDIHRVHQFRNPLGRDQPGEYETVAQAEFIELPLVFASQMPSPTNRNRACGQRSSTDFAAAMTNSWPFR